MAVVARVSVAVAVEAVVKSTTLGAMEQVAPAGALAQANATLPVVALWPVSVSVVEPEAPAETLKPAPVIAGAGTADGVFLAGVSEKASGMAVHKEIGVRLIKA